MTNYLTERTREDRIAYLVNMIAVWARELDELVDAQGLWVPVTERVPEGDAANLGPYLVYDDHSGYRGVATFALDHDGVRGWEDITSTFLRYPPVTHWMPLPDPPGRSPE